MKSQTLFSLLFALLYCPATMGAHPASLLANGSFDEDLSGWQQPFGTSVVWTALDVFDAPDSGSALASNTADPSNGGTQIALQQCVPIVAGDLYQLTVWLFLPSGQPFGSAIDVALRPYASDDCTGQALLGAVGVVQFEPNAWHFSSLDWTAVPLAQSAMLTAGVTKPVGESALAQGFIDEIALVPDRIHRNGFEALD